MNLHKSFSNTRQIFYMVASESELRARFLTKIAKNEITFHKKKCKQSAINRLAQTQYFLKSLFLTDKFQRH